MEHDRRLAERDVPWSESPFHAGEAEIHRRLGLDMDTFGRKVIRKYLPEQHRDFYHNLNFVVAATDEPQCSLLLGDPGFISSPDNVTLDLAYKVAVPAIKAKKGSRMGLLGIDMVKRRRNRLNATVLDHTDALLRLGVDQSFGNCTSFVI